MNGTKPANGILPVQQIQAAIDAGMITADTGIDAAQMQPASLDLRLGEEAWRVQASFLPGRGMSVTDKLDKFAMHRINLRDGAVLECGCVYIVKLQESLRLPDDISALANPKSSTGRLDIFTRLITDRAVEFESVAPGYEGPLYAEISPRTFSVLVCPGCAYRNCDCAADQLSFQMMQCMNCRQQPALFMAVRRWIFVTGLG